MQTLLLDIRSVHQGRGQPAGGQEYMVNFDLLTIGFATFEAHVCVRSCLLLNPAFISAVQWTTSTLLTASSQS